MKDIKYISTDTLNPYKDKYAGWFINLEKDYEGYKKGLYFGYDGWQRLTNDDNYDTTIIGGVSLPIFPDKSEFVYTGDEIEFKLVNEKDILDYVNVYNNKHVNADIYTVTVSLKYDKWTWKDGTNTPKEFTFIIKPEQVTSAKVILSKTNIELGEEIPYVESVWYQDMCLKKGIDYEVVYPEGNKNIITINFIGNYTGAITTTFNINPKKINRPVFENNIFSYNGDVINVYPDNWIDIRDYCDIFSNSQTEIGEYQLTIRLKDTDIYCWDDNSISPIFKDFIIAAFEIPLPEWENEYMYNITYDGKNHEFYPTNWDVIEQFCIISGESNINAGEYEVVVSLKNENLVWRDNSKTDKKQEYIINKFIVEYPIWDVKNICVYNGNYWTYKPVNWDNISKYVDLKNERHINAGEYEVVVSLKDKINYGWIKLLNIVNSDDATAKFIIKKAQGFFTVNPYIHGNFYVDDTVYCTATYVDNTCDFTYEWYVSKTNNINDAIYITSTKNNSYVISSNDVGYFIICKVVAKSSFNSNYDDGEAYVVSRTKVQKIVIYDGFDFEDKKYEDSISVIETHYVLPNIVITTTDNNSVIEYKIISGNDVANIYDINNGLLTLNGVVGDVIVEATIKNSDSYIYVPDTIRFVLHVYSNDTVLWGLYDKESETPENEVLYEGLIPENAKKANLKENEKGIHSCMFRKNFPFKKFDGSDQDYYGWYILIPYDKNLIEISENGGTTMDVEEVKLKNDNGTDLMIVTDGKKYRVYGKFNVAKTSDNWLLHILMKNY